MFARHSPRARLESRVFSFDSTVRYSECDETGTLSVLGMINYMQDCSMFHTESLGHGFEYLAEHHFAWFLTAWQVQIERLPHFNEHITISTNCYGMSRVLASRNFSIRDEKGNYLVRADSLFFTFDTKAGKPCRIPDSEVIYLSDDPKLDLPKTDRHVHFEGEGQRMEPIVVNEQHLDTNHHVNNAQYVAIADAIVRKLDADFLVRRICVQYKQMALLGDTMVPWVHTQGNGYVVNLTNEAGDSFAIVSLES